MLIKLHFILPLTFKDKVNVKDYVLDKGYEVKPFLKEFPEQRWCKGGLEFFLKKIDQTSD